MLKVAGMKKINFSGGEPFRIQGGKYLGELVRYCKEDLDLESVTVIKNGSKLTECWMAEYDYYLDIMAVSVDSFREEVGEQVQPPAEPAGGEELVQGVQRPLQAQHCRQQPQLRRGHEAGDQVS